MLRILAAVVLAASLIAVTGIAHGSSPGATGVLRVKERLALSSSVYVEGAYEYVSVRRMSTGALVLKRRFDLGEISLVRRLPTGSYRVSSWTRSCSGNCGHLDPPTLGCRRVVRVRAGATTRVTVLSAVGERCRIAV